MHELRGYRWRAGTQTVGAPAATRARATAPVLLAPVAITVAAVAGTVIGLPLVAVFGVTVGVAVAGGAVAHRTVSNVLGGLVLLLARPYPPGERLRLYVPDLHEVVEAEVLRIGLVTTTLCTGTGVLVVPNRQLLRVPPVQG